MRLLDRYLLRELGMPLGACLACFLIFWVGFDLLGRLADFQKELLTVSEIGLYYWYALPELLLTVLPVGLLLALLYALTNHARHQELTAIRAAGVSLWRLVVPYLAVGLLLSAGLYGLNEHWLADAPERAQQVRRRHLAGTNDSRWTERVNFPNQSAERYWNIGAFHTETAEMRVPSFREPLPTGAYRVVLAGTGKWDTAGWRLEHMQEFIHRHAQDPEPATKGEVYVALPELTFTPTEMAAWNGSDVVITNTLWRTNLVRETSEGILWKVGALCPTNGELRQLEVRLPLGKGAQRAVGALSGAWTNGAWRFFNAREFLYRSASESDPMIVPPTGPMPQLDLPNLTEEPDLIRSEIRIRSLNMGRAMRRPQLAVKDILGYRRLHHEIRPDLRALLDTQLHARLAAPWTCLVVVLIAVPFGAPSGRRNIFYGVAGSIGIAFAYFVVQRVGYALAQNGRLEPWLGAWLPNLVFAVLGTGLIARVR